MSKNFSYFESIIKEILKVIQIWTKQYLRTYLQNSIKVLCDKRMYKQCTAQRIKEHQWFDCMNFDSD